MSRQLAFEDLTGGINNVDTKANLNSSTRKTQSPDMVNVEYLKLGGIKSMEGNTQVGQTFNSAIVGGWEYATKNNRYMMIGDYYGNVSMFNNATETFDKIYQFPTPSDRMSFCNMNNGVVVTNGKDDLLFYDVNSRKKYPGTITGKTDDDALNQSTLTGSVDTAFTTNLKVGDIISIHDCQGTYKIVSITDDHEMVVSPKIILNVGTMYYGWNGNKQTYEITTEQGSDASVVDVTNTSVRDGEYTFINRGNGVNKAFIYYPGTETINGQRVWGVKKRCIVNGTFSTLSNCTDITQDYVIDSGNLYGINSDDSVTLIDNTGIWTRVAGVFGIRDTELCVIEDGEISVVDNSGVWTILPDTYTGNRFWYSLNVYSYVRNSYGILDGKLYKLEYHTHTNTFTKTQITATNSVDGAWTQISSSYHGYAINNGNIWKIDYDNNTATKISNENFTRVTGYIYETSAFASYAMALKDSGKLCEIKNDDSIYETSINTTSLACGRTIFNDAYAGNSRNSMCVYSDGKNARGYLNRYTARELIWTGKNNIENVCGDDGCFVAQDAINTTNVQSDIINNERITYINKQIATGNNWYLNSFSSNNVVNLYDYNLRCNIHPIGEVITLNKTSNVSDVYTNTYINPVNKIYNDTISSSEINNITYKNLSGNTLSYISNNSGTITFGVFERNQNADTYNQDEVVLFSNEPYYFSGIVEIPTVLTDSREEGERVLEEDIHFRGLAIQYYSGRLWIGGTDDDGNGILVYSAVGLPNNFDLQSDAGYLMDIYNDSSEVKALGLFSDFMTIHKEFNTYLLTCDGTTDSIAVKAYSNITCKSQQSWIVSNTKYFVYSDDFNDIYPLAQHTVWNDRFLGEPISQNIRNLFSEVRLFDTHEIFCVSRPLSRQMLFYLPTNNHPGSNYAVIYDFQTKSWLLRIVPQEVTIAFNYNNNIYIGTSEGKVLKEFSGNSFDGKPIVSYYKSPWFDWIGGYMQSFAEFSLELDTSYNNDFYIRTQKDGQSRFEDRNITNDRLFGNSLVWGGSDDFNNATVWDNDSWVKQTFDNIRMLLPNNVFEDFQIEIGTNKLGQAFAIYGYRFRRIEAEEAPW